MINDQKIVSSSAMIEENNSSAIVAKPNKKTKKKSYKDTKIQKQLKFSCYQNLSTRNVTKNTNADRSMNSFITRTNIIDQAFEKENNTKYYLVIKFPNKYNFDFIPDELNKPYERLSQLRGTIRNITYEANYNNTFDKVLIEEVILDLISIKQEIIEIYNKYNPNKPYQYSYLLEDVRIRLEDRMLDFVQAQLFNCYYFLNDYKNKELIIDQLIEQNSIICFELLNIMSFSSISNYDNLENFNFKDILTQCEMIEKSHNKFYHGKKHIPRNTYNTNNKLSIVASIVRLFLDNTHISYTKIDIFNKLSHIFLSLIDIYVKYYIAFDNHIKRIKQLSSGISFYFKNLDNPLFKEIHATLLTRDGIVFIENFSKLIAELKTASHEHESFDLLQKNKLISGVNLDTHNKMNNTKKNSSMQKIKQLFIKYNIPTDDIDSWYNIFIKNIFAEVFLAPSNQIVTLAEWIDLTKKEEAKQQANTNKTDDINNWLDIIVNEHKKLVDDQILWNDIPQILLVLLNHQMAEEFVNVVLGTAKIDKQKDLAILYVKTTQAIRPFLGTALSAIVNKNSCDDLLTDLDMLEFISQQTDKTKYIKSSKYLTAQIITYLINQNNNLDLTKKQLLFTKAEKLYLELASSGINQAYLLLAETIATFAKIKMYEQNFLESVNLYYQASNYCKILSEIDNIETNLQDLALTSMNCFSLEADVLRKINEEQSLLMQELTTPKTTTKKHKKSSKKTANSPTKIDKQDPSTEISITEFVNWHQTYKTPTGKPQSTKIFQTKKIKDINQLASRDEINIKQNFWRTTRELLALSANLATSYTLLVELIKNNYFKMLESQFKDGITQNDSWVVLLIYQKIAYYHFLQLKHVREIGNNANHLKLFYIADNKIPTTSKAKKITFENLSDEAELLMRKAIKLVCADITNIETKNIREIFLSLSPSIYSGLLPIYKNQLASLTSTYGHLKSLDDIEQGRRGKFRLAADLYDKADEINPNRLIRKQNEQAS